MLLVRIVSRPAACLLIDEAFLVKIPSRYSTESSSPSKGLSSSIPDIRTEGETPFRTSVRLVGPVLMFLFKEWYCLFNSYSLANYSP
jgi:hypothetical protein